MAVFHQSDRTKKILLPCSKIEISGIRCEMEQTYTLATLAINKFYQLKNDVEYVTPVFEFDAELRFIKKRNNHTIKISAKDIGNISASVLYESTNTSKPVLAEQESDGEYIIVFPSSEVESARNTFLKDGRVFIHIKFGESDSVLKRTHACSGERDENSMERLSEDLEMASIHPHDTDIIFHVDGKQIRVPKGLLASRSNYFIDHPDSEKEIYLNTYYDTVSCAVQYLYTGKLQSVDELTEQEIGRLLEVASSLSINSLRSKCSSYINQLIIQGDLETSGIDKEKCITS